MEWGKEQTIDGTALTSWLNRQTGTIGTICCHNAAKFTQAGSRADRVGSARLLSVLRRFQSALLRSKKLFIASNKAGVHFAGETQIRSGTQ